jgi:hypothetical protein
MDQNHSGHISFGMSICGRRFISISGHILTSDRDVATVLTKAYAKELVTKAEIFKAVTKTKKDIVITLVTTHGLKAGLWNEEVIDSVVSAEELMR